MTLFPLWFPFVLIYYKIINYNSISSFWYYSEMVVFEMLDYLWNVAGGKLKQMKGLVFYREMLINPLAFIQHPDVCTVS